MTREVRIERAKDGDGSALARLFHADMQQLGVGADLEELTTLARRAVKTNGEGCHLWVARYTTGPPFGVILVNEILSIKFPTRALWIEELYVDPDHRHGGVGRRLVETCLDWAHAEGFRGIELEAYRMNTGASILYRSLGFKRLARERYSFDLRELEWDDE